MKKSNDDDHNCIYFNVLYGLTGPHSYLHVYMKQKHDSYHSPDSSALTAYWIWPNRFSFLTSKLRA